MTREILRYLGCGILAAFITLGARMLFSLALPFTAATLCAQLVGLVTGYYLYRTFVWTGTARSIRSTIAPFVMVNLASVVIVLVVSITIRALLLKFYSVVEIVDLFAHASGLVCGAAFSLVGHRTFTFR